MEQGSGVSTENFTLDPSYQMDGSNYMLRTKRVDTTSYNELQGVTRPASACFCFPFILLPKPAHLPKTTCHHAC